MSRYVILSFKNILMFSSWSKEEIKEVVNETLDDREKKEKRIKSIKDKLEALNKSFERDGLVSGIISTRFRYYDKDDTIWIHDNMGLLSTTMSNCSDIKDIKPIVWLDVIKRIIRDSSMSQYGKGFTAGKAEGIAEGLKQAQEKKQTNKKTNKS